MVKAATRKWLGANLSLTPDELKVGIAAAGVMFFFTHGLPLWNEDYSQWLAQANQDLLTLIIRLISPITVEPQSWGFSDRPGQVLFYKIFSTLFGTWGTAYYFLKSVAFGALSVLIYRWMRVLGVEQCTAYFGIALFVTSTNALAAVMLHAEFMVYSQLIAVALVAWSIQQIENGPTTARKSGMPKELKRFLIAFFLVVYFGSKLKGDVRLVPLILLAFLYFYQRAKFQIYALPFGLTFLATLPWSVQMFKQLPPFVPGATGYTAPTYAPFSLTRIFDLLFSGMFSIQSASVSILAAVGLLIAILGVAYLIYAGSKEKLNAPDEKWGLFLIWTTIALLACSIMPVQGQSFQYQLRYTFLPLIPATFIAVMAMESALKQFSKWKWLEKAFLAVVALQCGLHLFHDYQYRKDGGRVITAVDRLYARVEQQHPNSKFFLFNNFQNYGYKSSTAPALVGRRDYKDNEDLKQAPVGNTFLASWASSLDARFVVDYAASGCGASLFDVIFPCQVSEGAMLLKYVGDMPEIAQAEQLDKQGNVAAAKQILEGYYNREPANHGAGFILSLYAYRSGDFQLMERIYESFGPYFPSHTSVLYNWGLAKQGLKKYSEAARLLTLAYKMKPRDLSIGLNLADAYYQQGKKSRALAMLDELKTVYPENNTLKNTYTAWSK